MIAKSLNRLSRAARRLRNVLAGSAVEVIGDSPFDIGDLALVNPLLERHGDEPIRADPPIDAAGAARYVLANLLGEPGLRSRFPRALHDGPDGPFAKWLIQKLVADSKAVEHVLAVLSGDFSERVRRIYEFRPDLRGIFPLGMTPQRRGDYLEWLLQHGRGEMGVTPEQAVWFFVRQDELPDRGLVMTWLLNAEWQRLFPHGLTAFGWQDFLAFLKANHGLTHSWVERIRVPRYFRPWDELAFLFRAKPELAAGFPAVPTSQTITAWIDTVGLPTPDTEWFGDLRADLSAGLPSRLGANVFTHFRFRCGMQQSGLSVVRSLEAVGFRTACRDMMAEFPCDLEDRRRFDGLEQFPVSVFVGGINTPPWLYLERTGIDLRDDVYRAGFVYWESEEPPEDLAERMKGMHEIWAATTYLADSFRKRATVPVVAMLPGVELPAFAEKERSYFGLPNDRYLFLFTYDMASYQPRKNPLGLVAAFRKSFRNDEPVGLVLKVSRGADFPDEFAELQATCRDSGVTLIDRVMPRGDVLALLKTCDAYASLHRTEGLGLGMAEAMLMGKPVVATAYSGNVDFMTPETAYLVEYQRVRMPDSSPYPKGSVWAEPSIDHAAEMLRRVYNDRSESEAVGARAKADLQVRLSYAAAGERMAARIREILGRTK